MSDDLFNMLTGMSDEKEKIIRGPLGGYPGSKMKSVEKILEVLPQGDAYVEVFGGSGIVFLNRKPTKLDVYNDAYGGVVSFYRCLRDPAKKQKLLGLLALVPNAREEFEWAKEQWNHSDDVERALRWYTMFQLSFAGLCKVFARSVSGRATNKLPGDLQGFEHMHKRLNSKTVQIENLRFGRCIRDYAGHNTVFYLDPPYKSSDIYHEGFTQHDHALLLDQVFATPGYFAVSGYHNPLYDSKPWDRVVEWEVYSPMASGETEKQSTRGKTTEVLYIKEA